MKYLLLGLLFSLPVLANNNLNLSLPNSPSNYQSDRFRTGNLDCSNAIGSSTNLEFGVMGIIDKKEDDLFPNNTDILGDTSRNVGVYARIIIPIGAPKERINCNTLYKLELEKKRLEVIKLQQEVANLKRLKFEN
jgi:hypothetical protein